MSAEIETRVAALEGVVATLRELLAAVADENYRFTVVLEEMESAGALAEVPWSIADERLRMLRAQRDGASDETLSAIGSSIDRLSREFRDRVESRK